MMDKDKVNEAIESWINGNKSHVYQQWLEMKPVEKAYFIYYLTEQEQSNFCRYCEAKEG